VGPCLYSIHTPHYIQYFTTHNTQLAIYNIPMSRQNVAILCAKEHLVIFQICIFGLVWFVFDFKIFFKLLSYSLVVCAIFGDNNERTNVFKEVHWLWTYVVLEWNYSISKSHISKCVSNPYKMAEITFNWSGYSCQFVANVTIVNHNISLITEYLGIANNIYIKATSTNIEEPNLNSKDILKSSREMITINLSEFWTGFSS
jgi:hypothetical protein